MSASTPTPQEQDRAMLRHALGELREVLDLLQLQHPGRAHAQVRDLTQRLYRHLNDRGPEGPAPEAA